MISLRTMRISERRPARDRPILLSQFSRITSIDTMASGERVERDAVPPRGGPEVVTTPSSRRRSRQTCWRKRSCSRCLSSSRRRRRLLSLRSRIFRQPPEHVCSVWLADGFGRYHFRQVVHRRRAISFIPARSGLRSTTSNCQPRALHAAVHERGAGSGQASRGSCVSLVTVPAPLDCETAAAGHSPSQFEWVTSREQGRVTSAEHRRIPGTIATWALGAMDGGWSQQVPIVSRTR